MGVKRPTVFDLKRLLTRARNLRGSVLRLRWRAVNLIAPRQNVYSRGLKFTLQCDNWITHYRWQTYNTKEPETLDWIDTRMRDGDTFFDIGANIGVYSIYAALRHNRGARVVAFEPEYANLHLLRDNIIKNGLQDRVDVYSIALSDCSGISHLHIQDLTPGSALHTEAKETLNTTITQHPVVWREGICTLTLDAFCDATLLQPNCMKIDVDGTEPKVLRGAMRTLRSPSLRSVIIELPDENRARDVCRELLCKAGLRREWWDPVLTSANEVWVRDSA